VLRSNLLEFLHQFKNFGEVDLQKLGNEFASIIFRQVCPKFLERGVSARFRGPQQKPPAYILSSKQASSQRRISHNRNLKLTSGIQQVPFLLNVKEEW
jgi:hypothetical protein